MSSTLASFPISRKDFRSFLAYYVTHTNRSDFQQAMFQAEIRSNSIRFFQFVTALIAIFIISMWPTDTVFFDNARIINAYFYWRICLLAIIVPFLLGTILSSFVRRNIFPLFHVGFLICMSFTGYLFGGMAGLDLSTPWFFIILLLPYETVVFSFRIFRRILHTVFIPFLYFIAFAFVKNGPENWNYGLMGIELNFYALNYDYMGLIIILVLAMSAMSILVGHMGYHLNRVNFFQSRKLKIQRKKIQELADHDQLTGLYNRRKFDNLVQDEFNRSRRYDRDMSIIMMDLDHFKDINDTYGHQSGDSVLEETGKLIQNITRNSDIASRYGGEEFCIALTETPIDKSQNIADRLREQLKDMSFSHNESSFSVTCSIGIASINPGQENFSDLLQEADKALYEAKNRGRDCVVSKT